MKIKELLEKISKINNYINNDHKDRTKIERLLLKSAKLPEEVGELYSELLKSLNFSRNGRTDYNKDNLEKEFADVIITTLVIACDMGIDIESQINEKINIVFERFGLE